MARVLFALFAALLTVPCASAETGETGAAHAVAIQAVADQAVVDQAAAAREAGARYGQALGALELCYGAKMTDKAKALETAYTGADLERFKMRAAKTFEVWLKVKDCQKQLDPNQCKIIMDKSCLAAEAEIGTEGKIMPGLVEFLKH